MSDSLSGGEGRESKEATGERDRRRSPAVVSLRLRAPAKINLGLRLTGARDDGYHLLESVFAPIDLQDEVEIELLPEEKGTDLELSFEPGGDLPEALAGVTAGPDNLMVRAAEVFRAAVGFEGRIRLGLLKRIPAGAGLGGGSSDAAAVLGGLSRLFGDSGPSSSQIEGLALGLGADVPFFLSPAPAFVTGIGEQIEPIEGLPALDLVVANPGISVATAEVYRVADALPAGAADSLTEPRAGSTMRAISRLRGETGDWAPALGELLVNDLQPAAVRLCPPIARLIERMREAGALGASMSGSGATVFGVFDSAERAARAAEVIRADGSGRHGGAEPGNGAGEAETRNSRTGASDCWVRVTRIIV